MLVLTRKLHEKVFIKTPDGKDIAVTICGISGYGKKGKVKIGIDAGKEYFIAREELLNQDDDEEEYINEND